MEANLRLHAAWKSMSNDSLPHPSLQGATHCLWSTGGSFYNYGELGKDRDKLFVAYWDSLHGSYGWHSPLQKDTGHSSATQVVASVHPLPAYGPGPLIEGQNLYNVSYDIRLPDDVEVGFARWLKGPDYFVEGNSWTSHSFVGTRVNTANHTTCCCQVMQGRLDAGNFTLTEHCRTVLPWVSKENPWYVGLTRDDINSKISEDCAPWNPANELRYPNSAVSCPTNNQTAMALYSDRPGFFPIKPWVEVYEGPYLAAKDQPLPYVVLPHRAEPQAGGNFIITLICFIMAALLILSLVRLMVCKKVWRLTWSKFTQDDESESGYLPFLESGSDGSERS